MARGEASRGGAAGGRGRWPRAALVALVVFAVAGVGLVDDYSLDRDDDTQRHLGHEWLDYVLGDPDLGLVGLAPMRFVGAVLETPLAFIERWLGLADTRPIYLTRHLLTHLLFLAGAGCAALLVLRLFGGGWLALLAGVAFALHPRLYAHSFVNSKDLSFAALFMVCLYLTHRAFRRGTAGAFALLGVGVGVLVNLRVMGALLVALVAGLMALDVALASGWAARRRALARAGAFAAAAGAALFAVSPYLWSDPAALADALRVAADPIAVPKLFQGELLRWPDLPAGYIPTWIAVTTPPAALVLCGVGVAAVASGGLARLGVHAASPRFGWLTLACAALALLGVAVVDGAVFNGWRQLYFLWAPLALLAVFGARWLAGVGRRRALRLGVHGLAAAGVVAAASQMASLHPHQALYFSLLVDRDAPERLRGWYAMDHRHLTHREVLERVLERHPGATITGATPGMVEHVRRHGLILPPALRRRVIAGPPAAADFVVTRPPLPRSRWGQEAWGGPHVAPVAHAVTVYDNTVSLALALDAGSLGGAVAARQRAEHARAAAAPRVARSGFDLHLGAGALLWLKAPCAVADVAGAFTLRATAADGREFGPAIFDFARHGVLSDGACMIRTPLPAGPLTAIEAGQTVVNGPDLWRVAIAVSPTGTEATAAARPLIMGARAARGHFDVYVGGGGGHRGVTYVREGCRPGDTAGWGGRIFLHVFPAEPSALPRGRAASGFDNRDFSVQRQDEALIRRLGGRCVAWRRLPDYPIARLATGQLRGLAEVAWKVEIKFPAAGRAPRG